MKRAHVFGVLLLACVAASAVAIRGKEKKAGVSAEPSPAKTEAAGERIAALERELALLDVRVRSAERKTVETRAPAERVERSEAADEQRAEVKDLRTPEERNADAIHHYESQFSAENKDPEWSGETELKITELLASASIEGSLLAEVDCQSTLCRMEIVHATPASQGEFFQRLPKQGPFQTSGFYHPAEGTDGSIRTVLYLARNVSGSSR